MFSYPGLTERTVNPGTSAEPGETGDARAGRR